MSVKGTESMLTSPPTALPKKLRKLLRLPLPKIVPTKPPLRLILRAMESKAPSMERTRDLTPRARASPAVSPACSNWAARLVSSLLLKMDPSDFLRKTSEYFSAMESNALFIRSAWTMASRNSIC